MPVGVSGMVRSDISDGVCSGSGVDAGESFLKGDDSSRGESDGVRKGVGCGA
jgi:hypothetical protein